MNRKVLPLLLLILSAGSKVALADTTELFFGNANDSAQGGNSSNTATALFSLSNTGVLTITLTALSSPALVPTDVLTGLFFDTSPGTLTNGTASLKAGSEAINGDGSVDSSVTNANVGNLWGYAAGVSAHGDTFAISATGAVNGLGHANFGDGSALQGVGGGDVIGIATAANGGVTGKGPYIDNSIVFTFTTSNFSLSDLGPVIFQYGTSLSEPYSTGTQVSVSEASMPELLAVDFGMLGVVGGFYYQRRKRGVSAVA